MWNNRVFEQEDGSLTVHETFYTDNEVDGWGEESELRGAFEELDHMISHVELILKDLYRAKSGELPVVKYADWRKLLSE